MGFDIVAEVYAIGFPNGKLYIGMTNKTAAKRLSEHIADTRRGLKLAVHNAFRKYGRNVRLVILGQDISWNEAKDLEIWWINRLDTFGPNGYNLTVGGDGVTMTPETRAKMSAAKRGKKLTAEHKAKVGRKLTAEHKAKLLKANIGNQYCLGKHRKFSVEHRRKLSEAGKRDWRKRKSDL